MKHKGRKQSTHGHSASDDVERLIRYVADTLDPDIVSDEVFWRLTKLREKLASRDASYRARQEEVLKRFLDRIRSDER